MSPAQRWLRWSGFLIGGIILFWLPIEDLNLTTVVILAAPVCFWLMMVCAVKKRIPSRFYAWGGLFAGLMVGPMAFIFMVFKIGLHHHLTPDFTLTELLQLLRVSPVWGLSGFMAGLGMYLYLLSRSR